MDISMNMNEILEWSDAYWNVSLDGKYRALTAAEREQLRSQGNVASPEALLGKEEGSDSDGWNSVFVSCESTSLTLSRMRNCFFYGVSAYLGPFSGHTVAGPQDSLPLPSGLYNSVFSGRCIIGKDALIRNVSLISNAVVGSHSCIVDCGSVVGAPEGSSFGVGGSVQLGPSTGGRGFKIYPSMSYVDVCTVALSRGNASLIALNLSNAQAEAAATTRKYSVIGERCYVMRCEQIHAAIISHSAIVSSCRIDASTILSSIARQCVAKSATILNCFLEEGVEVVGPCRLESSVLFESAAVGEDAIVINSVLSPDASVAGAECANSLVGPFIGIHHASLLIACTWPMGRGNVSYGAMLGANHTGRVNDQEFLSGEGCFYGLGVKLKFPFNTIEAPYSLFSAGTECLPQRLSYPFSLISPPEGSSAALSPALNCIRPGWVLGHSPFTLLRSDMKFSKRKRSQRIHTDHSMARVSIARLVVAARNRLRSMIHKNAGNGTSAPVYYTEADDSGLGKNVMLEEDRARGERAYSSYLKLFALETILRNLVSLSRDELISFGVHLHDTVSATAALQSDSEWGAQGGGSSRSALAWVVEDATELYGAQEHPGKIGMDALHPFVKVIVASEYPICDTASVGPEAYLHMLLGELRQLAEARHHLEVACRERDASRGVRIIPDYLYVHGLLAPREERGDADGMEEEQGSLSYRDTDAVIAESSRRYRALLSSIDVVVEIMNKKDV